MSTGEAAPNVSILWSSSDREIFVHYFRYRRFHCLEHTHGELSINIPLSSPLSYRIGDRIETVTPGSALVIQPGEWHTGVDLSEGVTISISNRSFRSLSSAIRLNSDFANGHVSLSHLIQDERLKSVGRELAHEMSHPAPGRDMVITSMVTQYLIYLLRQWAVPLRDDLLPTRYLPVIEMLRAIEYMNNCPKRAFSLRGASMAIRTSQSRFVSLFSASTGSSPLVFYNRIVIQKAKQLLVESDISIKEVAFALEFQSESHFCNLFRSISGSSPTAFRSEGKLAPLYECTVRHTE